jgi:ribosome-binding protein aMBF1 (putative translation factor)
MKGTVPEAVVDGHSAEDFATATQRVKGARSRLLGDKRAADAHAALSEQIAHRLDTKKATLGEVRRALGLTQAQLAEMLDLGQGDISRLERRRNLYLNTLARFVEATGGRLRITAIYGDTEVTLDLRDDGAGSDAEQAEEVDSAG